MKKVLRLFICIFILALAASFVLDKIEVKYKSAIDAVSAEYSLNEKLVYALIMAESNFHPDAHSVKGATGLMQLTDDTAAWCAEKIGDASLAEKITEPDANIRLGCFYLKYLLEKYGGSESAALAAYNAGSSNVDEWLSDSAYSPDGVSLTGAPFPETDRYIKKIAIYKKIYTLLYGDIL